MGTATIEDLIETSPFQNVGDPLLMPFLVFEAKSEDGRGFQRCGIQTAIPLWVLLNYQLQLQNQAGSLSEQGGPLAWYIAYRGDSWRVSGSCIVTRGNQTIYVSMSLFGLFVTFKLDNCLVKFQSYEIKASRRQYFIRNLGAGSNVH